MLEYGKEYKCSLEAFEIDLKAHFGEIFPFPIASGQSVLFHADRRHQRYVAGWYNGYGWLVEKPRCIAPQQSDGVTFMVTLNASHRQPDAFSVTPAMSRQLTHEALVNALSRRTLTHQLMGDVDVAVDKIEYYVEPDPKPEQSKPTKPARRKKSVKRTTKKTTRVKKT